MYPAQSQPHPSLIPSRLSMPYVFRPRVHRKLLSSRHIDCTRLQTSSRARGYRGPYPDQCSFAILRLLRSKTERRVGLHPVYPSSEPFNPGCEVVSQSLRPSSSAFTSKIRSPTRTSFFSCPSFSNTKGYPSDRCSSHPSRRLNS